MKKLFRDVLYVFTCVLPVLFLTASAFSALAASLAVTLAVVLMSAVRFAVPFLVPKAAEKTVLFIAAVTGVSMIALLCRNFPGMPSATSLYMPLCVASALLLMERRGERETVLREGLSALRLCLIFSSLTMAMGILRELFGVGRLFSLPVAVSFLPPMEAFSKPTGALLIAALVFAVFSFLVKEEKTDE